MQHQKIVKHKCNHCHSTYYTIDDTPDCCPYHYVDDGAFYNHNYTIEDERKLSALRHKYVGKVIPVEDGLIIILEILDFNNVEFILMPSHRIFVASFSYIDTLLKSIEN